MIRSALLAVAVALALAGASCKSDNPASDMNHDAGAGNTDAASPPDGGAPDGRAPDGRAPDLATSEVAGQDVLAPPGGPAFDCAATNHDYCVAVAGTVNGKQFEFTCLPTNRGVVSLTTTRLALSCQDATQSLTFRVAAPEKGNGTFQLPVAETQAADSDLEMLKLTEEAPMAQMNSTAANFVQGLVRVTASADGLRAGTFEGTWRTPAAGCRAFTYSCAEGGLRGSFRYRRP